MAGRVSILKEVKASNAKDRWVLCFQYCKYQYGNDTEDEYGYRFIWRRPDGNLQAARGQARIPDMADLMSLVSKAMAKGWGNITDGAKFEASLNKKPSSAKIEEQPLEDE